MLEVLDHRSLGELTPLAEIEPIADSFYQRNIKFVPDTDDWGKCHIAAFRLEGISPFAIVHYEHDPKEKAHLFILGDVPSEILVAVVSAIAAALDLPSEIFHWRDERGEIVSPVPGRAA